MQADFILFLRDYLVNPQPGLRHWFPETMLYANNIGAIEIFARSRSLKYFDKIKVLFVIDKIDGFSPLFRYFHDHPDDVPRWTMHGALSLNNLIGINEIGTLQ